MLDTKSSTIMTAYAPDNICVFASTRETSVAVALAIFEIADEGDESRMWTDPTDAETAAVTARAWEIANRDEDTLRWGVVTLRRPQ